MMSGRSKVMIAEAAAVAGPLLILSGARLLLGSAPGSVSAGPGATPPAVVAAPASKPLTTEQQRALVWINAIPRGTPLASPMDHPVSITRVQKEPEPAPRIVESVPLPTPSSPLMGLTLTGVLGNTSGGLAAINGRIYKVGDRVNGLRVTAIDIKTNSVELTTPDGAVVRLVRDHQ